MMKKVARLVCFRVYALASLPNRYEKYAAIPTRMRRPRKNALTVAGNESMKTPEKKAKTLSESGTKVERKILTNVL